MSKTKVDWRFSTLLDAVGAVRYEALKNWSAEVGKEQQSSLQYAFLA